MAPFKYVPTMEDIGTKPQRPATPKPALPKQVSGQRVSGSIPGVNINYRYNYQLDPYLQMKPEPLSAPNVQARPTSTLKPIGGPAPAPPVVPKAPPPSFGAQAAGPPPLAPRNTGWGSVPSYQPAQAMTSKPSMMDTFKQGVRNGMSKVFDNSKPSTPGFFGNLKQELQNPTVRGSVGKFTARSLAKGAGGALVADMLFPNELNAADDLGQIRNWKPSQSWNPTGGALPQLEQKPSLPSGPIDPHLDPTYIRNPEHFQRSGGIAPGFEQKPKAATPAQDMTKVGPPLDERSFWPALPKPLYGQSEVVPGNSNIRTIPGRMENIGALEIPRGSGIATMGDQTAMLRGGGSLSKEENDAVIAERERNYGPLPTIVGGAGGVMSALPGTDISTVFDPNGQDFISNIYNQRRAALNDKLSGERDVAGIKAGADKYTADQGLAGHRYVADQGLLGEYAKADANRYGSEMNYRAEQEKAKAALPALNADIAYKKAQTEALGTKAEQLQEAEKTRRLAIWKDLVAKADVLLDPAQKAEALSRADAYLQYGDDIERYEATPYKAKVNHWVSKDEPEQLATYAYRQRTTPLPPVGKR